MPEKTLKQEVETRWNSTYDMLTSILDSDEAIASVLRSEIKSTSLLLTPEDVINLRSIQKVLAPWKKLTVFMSAEQYPTISFVAPSLHKLLSTALKSSEDDSELIKKMKKAMSDDLKTTYRDENVKMMLNTAALLDPRFRELDFLKDAEERKKVKTKAKENMVDLEKKYPLVKREPDILLSQNTDQPLPSHMDDLNPTKKAKVETDFFAEFFSDIVVTNVKPPSSAMERAKKEMQLYVSLPTVTGKDGQLGWWKEHKIQNPMIAKLA